MQRTDHASHQRTDIAAHKPTDHHHTANPARSQRWKVAFLIAVILAAVGWITYMVWPSPTLTIEPSAGAAASSAILNAIGDRDDLLATVQIRPAGEPPSESVRVTGSVKTKAALDELQGIVRGAAGSMPVEFDVKVKP